MPLSLGILFEGVRHGNRSITQILAVHGVHCGIRSFKTGEINEGEPFGVACFGISHDFWRLQNYAESGESVVQQFFIHFGVQIANENVCTNIEIFLVGRGFVHTNGFPVELYHVHDFDGIVGVFLAQEFDEAVALVRLGDAVFGHVDVHDGACLHEEFPQEGFGDFVVQAADVDCGIWGGK